MIIGRREVPAAGICGGGARGWGKTNTTFSISEIDDLGQGAEDDHKLGTFSEIDFTIVGLGTPREIPGRGGADGPNLFWRVMGAAAGAGRLLGPATNWPNAQGAIVLTYKFWKTSLHSDAKRLGKTVRWRASTGARNAVIVGVLEPSVPYPVATEIICEVVTSPHICRDDGDGAIASHDGGVRAARRRGQLEQAAAELRTPVCGDSGGAPGGVQSRRPLTRSR